MTLAEVEPYLGKYVDITHGEEGGMGFLVFVAAGGYCFDYGMGGGIDSITSIREVEPDIKQPWTPGDPQLAKKCADCRHIWLAHWIAPCIGCDLERRAERCMGFRPLEN